MWEGGWYRAGEIAAATGTCCVSFSLGRQQLNACPPAFGAPPQIEEHYISAAELGRLTGVPAEVILRTELTALQVGG